MVMKPTVFVIDSNFLSDLAVGDSVEEDEVVGEIETDKVGLLSSRLGSPKMITCVVNVVNTKQREL